MNALERRTRWLLRAYPPSWRQERGQEIVGTVLDLSDPGQRWPSLDVAKDLVVSGWAARANEHRREAGGWLAAGWRAATVAAVVVLVAISVAWMSQWVTSGFVPMLPVLGNASAATFLVALGGFAVAAVVWLVGLARAARWVSGIALVSWTVTVLIFQMALAGGAPDQLVLVAWTYLAVLATWALWQPPPSVPSAVGAVTGVACSAVAWWSWSGDPGYGLVLADLRFAMARVDTLEFLVLATWALAAVVALLVIRRDPRMVVALAALLPVVALAYPPVVAGPLSMVLVALALVVLGAAVTAIRLVDRTN